MKRRKFIKNMLISTAAISTLGSLYSWQVEPFWLEFVKLHMGIHNLPKHLIGKTIMQISDVHVGTKFDHQFIIDSFIKAQKYQPDFVVYTGDYISYENDEQLLELKKVFKHAVQGVMGTVGILGNHDYGKNWSQQEIANQITTILKESGIAVLNNQSIKIDGLTIIGLDDYWGLNFNPSTILKTINPLDSNLVLCHNPDVCDLNIWNDYNGWILSGHTHGGQVKPPFLNPPILPVKNKNYNSGKINLKDGRTLYINRALGHLHQVRFNVRPEITIFTLQKT